MRPLAELIVHDVAAAVTGTMLALDAPLPDSAPRKFEAFVETAGAVLAATSALI
jgi:hypothetical protein